MHVYRMYFTQYQYMPFYIASLAILYYLPYVVFRAVNSDVIALKKDVLAPGEGECTTGRTGGGILYWYNQ